MRTTLSRLRRLFDEVDTAWSRKLLRGVLASRTGDAMLVLILK